MKSRKALIISTFFTRQACFLHTRKFKSPVLIFCQRLLSKCVILISIVHIMAPLDWLFFAPTCVETIRLHIPTAGATQQHLSCYLTLGEAVEPCTYHPRQPCIYVAKLYFGSTGSSLTTRLLRLHSCSFCRLKRHFHLEMQRVNEIKNQFGFGLICFFCTHGSWMSPA